MTDPTPAVASRITVSAFPTVYPDPLVANARLQTALDHAISAGPGTTWRVPVAIVDLNPNGSRPCATFRGAEEHFSASLLKVGAMYAAFELLATARAAAGQVGPTTKRAFFADLAAYLDPLIIAKAATIPALNGLQKRHCVPNYAKVFEATSSPSGLSLDFTAEYKNAQLKMIGVSDNSKAADCIHGLGYGYLNGTLSSGGFLDTATNEGLWLAGDFLGTWPYFRIQSVNDDLVAQAASVIRLARLFTLIADNKLVNAASSGEMRTLLAAAVTEREVFIDRTPGINFTVTHTKVGLAPLKPKNSGRNVSSEASIIQRNADGRRFVVAWQNLIFNRDSDFAPISKVVDRTMAEYPTPTP